MGIGGCVNPPTESFVKIVASVATVASFASDVKDWLSESAVFAWRFIKTPTVLGTPFVLSPFVAKKLLDKVNSHNEAPPQAYLEVGPGTGAMTSKLVKRLRAQDTLDLVEIDPALCEILRKKFEGMVNVNIHNSPIQEWNSQGRKFNVIVTTVPLNSLPSLKTLQEIFKAFCALVTKDGYISFAEYVGTSTASKAICFGQRGKEIHAIVSEKIAFFKKHSVESNIVIANIPPARVVHCKVNTNHED